MTEINFDPRTNIELAREMADAEAPFRDCYLELCSQVETFQELHSDITSTTDEYEDILRFNPGASQVLTSISDSIANLSKDADDMLTGANTEAEGVQQSYSDYHEKVVPLLGSLSSQEFLLFDTHNDAEELSVHFDNIPSYTEGKTISEELEWRAETAAERKARISAVLKETNSPLTVDDLTKEQVRNLIPLTEVEY